MTEDIKQNDNPAGAEAAADEKQPEAAPVEDKSEKPPVDDAAAGEQRQPTQEELAALRRHHIANRCRNFLGILADVKKVMPKESHRVQTDMALLIMREGADMQSNRLRQQIFDALVHITNQNAIIIQTLEKLQSGNASDGDNPVITPGDMAMA